MGVYSTMYITRDDAKMLIMKKMFNYTDAELEDMLFAIYGPKTLNNFTIVHEYSAEDEYGFPIQYKGQEWRFD